MKPRLPSFRVNLWGGILALLVMAGVYAYWVGVGRGVFSGTSLFPWDLTFGLAVLCGSALSAGGFLVAATIRILNLDNYQPIARVCLAMGFVGYVVACLGFLTTGRAFLTPETIGILLLFGLVPLAEFAPELLARIGRSDRLRWLKSVRLPLLLLAVVFSLRQQLSLADGLIRDTRMSPLWATPQLAVQFLISAACAAVAAVLFASWHTKNAFAKGLSPEHMAGLGKVLATLLFFYLGLRVVDYLSRSVPLFVETYELQNLLLGLEMSLFFVPLWLLAPERNRCDPRVLYYCSVTVLAALITNRLDTCITSVEATTGVSYLPSWNEYFVACSVIALGIALFGETLKRLPVFVACE